MAEEIQEAIQIIRVGYDGIEIVMRVCGGSIEEMKKVIDFLIAVMDHEKTMGKTDMRKLLVKGGDLQVFQFQTQDMRKVKKMAKKYGILYAVLPDINPQDGMSEIVFHTEAVPRVNMMVQKLKFGRIATFDDYLNNKDKKEMDEMLSFLKGQKEGNRSLHTEEVANAEEALEGLIEKVGTYIVEKQRISVEDVKESFNLGNEQVEKVMGQLERMGAISKDKNGQYKALMNKEAFLNRMGGYQELAQRIKTAAVAQNPDLTDITITKTLIAEENDHAIKTRIPGTWGENARYMWLAKDQIMEIHAGKTILAFLDNKKDYKMYSGDNRVVGTMKGKELYEGHYDRVGAEVRKQYADAARKANGHEYTRKRKNAPEKMSAPLKR